MGSFRFLLGLLCYLSIAKSCSPSSVSGPAAKILKRLSTKFRALLLAGWLGSDQPVNSFYSKWAFCFAPSSSSSSSTAATLPGNVCTRTRTRTCISRQKQKFQLRVMPVIPTYTCSQAKNIKYKNIWLRKIPLYWGG